MRGSLGSCQTTTQTAFHAASLPPTAAHDLPPSCDNLRPPPTPSAGPARLAVSPAPKVACPLSSTLAHAWRLAKTESSV